MIEASEAWKNIQQRFLLPETYVEIDCAIAEAGLQNETSASGTNEAIFSDVDSIRGISDTSTDAKYATLEPNLWALDGTHSILPDEAPYGNAGYVSDIAQSGSVTLSLPVVHTAAIPGITITWSSEYGEYPHVFTVTAYNGDTVVAETTVTDNNSPTSVVTLDIENYDRVTVTVHNWCLPDHRTRIDQVFLGHILTFTKNEIINFTHEQYGSLLSGELPKYSVKFSIDNSDSRWNPNNPTGMERYLSERQKITVRYGLDIGGTVEWIKAGTFYLSEWSAPSNGFEAMFVARDVFEFLIGAKNPAALYAPLTYIADSALAVGSLPADVVVDVDESLSQYSGEYVGDGTAAEMIQKCANASCSILRYDRDGVLHIEPLDKTITSYIIPLALAYSHPEVSLSKPLKSVSVDYGEAIPYELAVSSSGEVQTISNDFIVAEDQAADVAAWTRDMLSSRKTISGEFRADPRLDLFDVVTIESKFGAFAPVVITDVQYTYNGSFKATYVGQVIS